MMSHNMGYARVINPETGAILQDAAILANTTITSAFIFVILIILIFAIFDFRRLFKDVKKDATNLRKQIDSQNKKLEKIEDLAKKESLRETRLYDVVSRFEANEKRLNARIKEQRTQIEEQVLQIRDSNFTIQQQKRLLHKFEKGKAAMQNETERSAFERFEADRKCLDTKLKEQTAQIGRTKMVIKEKETLLRAAQNEKGMMQREIESLTQKLEETKTSEPEPFQQEQQKTIVFKKVHAQKAGINKMKEHKAWIKKLSQTKSRALRNEIARERGAPRIHEHGEPASNPVNLELRNHVIIAELRSQLEESTKAMARFEGEVYRQCRQFETQTNQKILQLQEQNKKLLQEKTQQESQAKQELHELKEQHEKLLQAKAEHEGQASQEFLELKEQNEKLLQGKTQLEAQVKEELLHLKEKTEKLLLAKTQDEAQASQEFLQLKEQNEKLLQAKIQHEAESNQQIVALKSKIEELELGKAAEILDVRESAREEAEAREAQLNSTIEKWEVEVMDARLQAAEDASERDKIVLQAQYQEALAEQKMANLRHKIDEELQAKFQLQDQAKDQEALISDLRRQIEELQEEQE